MGEQDAFKPEVKSAENNVDRVDTAERLQMASRPEEVRGDNEYQRNFLQDLERGKSITDAYKDNPEYVAQRQALTEQLFSDDGKSVRPGFDSAAAQKLIAMNTQEAEAVGKWMSKMTQQGEKVANTAATISGDDHLRGVFA